MMLPRFEIRRDKISAYLLDITSKRGAPKAKFFLGRGFDRHEEEVLVNALAAHGFGHWPGISVTTAFGTKHVLVGPMLCPDGTSPSVLTVWMVRPGSPTASLVTAYPTEARPACPR